MAKKILIVEDSNLMVAVISNFVRKDFPDIEVLSAHSGEDGIKLYKENKPNLVFMDIRMPGIDGLTALEEIKKIDSDACVVMCTSLKEPEQEAKANSLGAKGYILKPFSRQDIVDAINANI